MSRDSEFFKELRAANPDAVYFSESFFDPCIIGAASRMNQPAVVVYDGQLMVEAVMLYCELSFDEALEYLEFNTWGAWFGEHTPLIMFPQLKNREGITLQLSAQS